MHVPTDVTLPFCSEFEQDRKFLELAYQLKYHAIMVGTQDKRFIPLASQYARFPEVAIHSYYLGLRWNRPVSFHESAHSFAREGLESGLEAHLQNLSFVKPPCMNLTLRLLKVVCARDLDFAHEPLGEYQPKAMAPVISLPPPQNYETPIVVSHGEEAVARYRAA